MQRSRKGYMTIAKSRKAIVQVKAGQRIAIFETLAGGQDHDHNDVTVTSAEGEPMIMKEKKSLLKGTKVKIEKMSKEKSKDTK